MSDITALVAGLRGENPPTEPYDPRTDPTNGTLVG